LLLLKLGSRKIKERPMYTSDSSLTGQTLFAQRRVRIATFFINLGLNAGLDILAQSG
jgi:hypothetical protein